MGAAFFYHLTDRRLEEVLPTLLERALAQGWRVAVRGTDGSRLAALDEALWTHPADGFLPHGIDGGDREAEQPVLLTAAAGRATNAPDCTFAVHGAGVTAEEVAASARCAVVFDGTDADELAAARSLWKSLAAAGAAAQYWAGEGGRWEKRAESLPAAGG